MKSLSRLHILWSRKFRPFRLRARHERRRVYAANQ